MPASRTDPAPQDHDDAIADELLRRLRRVEGQVRGIQQMIEARRDCRDVVTQIAAANKALEQVGFRLVAERLTECLAARDRDEAGFDVDEIQRLFLKLA